MSESEAPGTEAVTTEPEDYRRSVVWLVPYPAQFPLPQTEDELKAAMQWVVGVPYVPAFMARNTYDVFPRETLRGMVRNGWAAMSSVGSTGWCELYGMTAAEAERRRERVIFYEATPGGIEVSAPYGDDFTHAITAAWAFALAESFSIDARPIRAEERHAWRESFGRN